MSCHVATHSEPPVRKFRQYLSSSLFPSSFLLPPSSFLPLLLHSADTQGFLAPYGLTTAEQRHKKFAIDYGENVPVKRKHECKWNGPVWPYATSMCLTALANALNKVRSGG